MSGDRKDTSYPWTADDIEPIIVPDYAGIWTFGDHLRHLAAHAGHIPLELDELVAALSASAVAFLRRTLSRQPESVTLTFSPVYSLAINLLSIVEDAVIDSRAGEHLQPGPPR